jgi:hypothetical protein
MNQVRLRDQVDSSDADVGMAGALVASATRLAPSEARKQRVLAALDGERRRRPLRRGRIAFVLAAVVASSAALANVLPRLAHVFSRTPQVAPPAEPARKGHQSPIATPPAIEVLPLPTAEPPAERPKRHKAAAIPAAPPAAAEDEAGSLLAAVQAMRRDHDAALALARLDDYFQHFPNGALEEEALGLGIEAGTTLGDARAARYAGRYLEQHPEGRFRAAAQRALERFGSKEATP